MRRRERVRGWKEGESSRGGDQAGFTHGTACRRGTWPCSALVKCPRRQVAIYLCCLDGDHLLMPGKYFPIVRVKGCPLSQTLEGFYLTLQYLNIFHEVSISTNTHNLFKRNGDFPSSEKRSLPGLGCWEWSRLFVSFSFINILDLGKEFVESCRCWRGQPGPGIKRLLWIVQEKPHKPKAVLTVLRASSLQSHMYFVPLESVKPLRLQKRDTVVGDIPHPPHHLTNSQCYIEKEGCLRKRSAGNQYLIRSVCVYWRKRIFHRIIEVGRDLGRSSNGCLMSVSVF